MPAPSPSGTGDASGQELGEASLELSMNKMLLGVQEQAGRDGQGRGAEAWPGGEAWLSPPGIRLGINKTVNWAPFWQCPPPGRSPAQVAANTGPGPLTALPVFPRPRAML